MRCTNKEQETCQVEKMGCEGCAYNIDQPLNTQLVSQLTKEIVEIENRLSKISRLYNFTYVFTSEKVVRADGSYYDKVSIEPFIKLS